MSKPPNSLQAVLERQAHAPASVVPHREPAPETQAPDAESRPARFYRPSREGKRLIAGHFTPKVAKQLKLLAVEEDKSVQALLEEALELLFVKKGKSKV